MNDKDEYVCESTEWVHEAMALKDKQVLDELSRPDISNSWNDVITIEAIRRILSKLIKIEKKLK